MYLRYQLNPDASATPELPDMVQQGPGAMVKDEMPSLVGARLSLKAWAFVDPTRRSISWNAAVAWSGAAVELTVWVTTTHQILRNPPKKCILRSAEHWQ